MKNGAKPHTKPIIIVSLLLILAMQLPLLSTAFAEGTSLSYTYDSWGDSVPTRTPYAVNKVYGGTELGCGALDAPEDLFVTQSQQVYVLDSGKSRIVQLSSAMEFLREILPVDESGEAIDISGATGIFVRENGELYLADKKNKTVQILDETGKRTGRIDCPDPAELPPNFGYVPSKVTVTSAGVVNVISANTSSGALQFDPQHNFVGFYGSEPIQVNPVVLMNRLWKRILNKEQAARMSRTVPTAYVNFDIDQDDFVYTVKGGAERGVRAVRKLNPSGVNIMKNPHDSLYFGDFEVYMDLQKNLIVVSSLTDVTVDSKGFITIIEKTRNRLFQYDQSGNLLFAFGGTEKQDGNFLGLRAVASMGDNLLVLDGSTNTITVFTPTEFGANVREGVWLHNDGRYQDAVTPWEKVIAADKNFELANRGLGNAYKGMGDYHRAMEYYQRGNDWIGYSKAFEHYRAELLREHFELFLAGLVVAVILLALLLRYYEAHKKDEYSEKVYRWTYPFHCILHPMRAYGEMKYEKKGSLMIANIILGLLFLSSVFTIRLTAFHFNSVKDGTFNIAMVLLKTIGLFAAWCLANWLVSTLCNGKGHFREIWIFSAYALLPFVIMSFVLVGMSHLLSFSEETYLFFITVIGYGLTALNLLMAIKDVHLYNLKETVKCIFFTIVGIIIVVILATISYAMFVQFANFVKMVFSKLILR
ncbi:MAG: YIP1 family protein [Angelakisella sp.]